MATAIDKTLSDYKEKIEDPEFLSVSHPDFERQMALSKTLYMDGLSITEISKETKIKLFTLKARIYGSGKNKFGWQAEKEASKRNLLRHLTADKQKMLMEMCDTTLAILYQTLQDLKADMEHSKKKLSVREAKGLVSLITDVDQIIQANKDDQEKEEQKYGSTEAIAPTDPRELKARLDAADPMATPTESKDVPESPRPEDN